MDDKEKANIRERGRRITDVRNMLRMTRLEFSEFLVMSPHTMRSWEQGQYGGITQRGADIICKKVLEKRLHVDAHWLITGEGKYPIFLEIDESNQKLAERDRTFIAEELKAFVEKYPHNLVLEIKDENMSPYYHVGDTIAGSIIDLASYNNMMDSCCLIEKFDGSIICCLLKQINGQLLLELMTGELLDISSVEKLAIVTWFRRPRFSTGNG